MSIFGAHEERSSTAFSVLKKFWSKLCLLCAADRRLRVSRTQPIETELPSSPPPLSSRESPPLSTTSTLTGNDRYANKVVSKVQLSPYHHHRPFHPPLITKDNKNDQLSKVNKLQQSQPVNKMCMLRVTSI